jgi:hypothetical protein
LRLSSTSQLRRFAFFALLAVGRGAESGVNRRLAGGVVRMTGFEAGLVLGAWRTTLETGAVRTGGT